MAKPRGRPVAAAERVGPTPEVLRRRLDLAGPNGDPDKTSAVLDLILTRGYISDAQWRAGRRYVYARNAICGKPAAGAISQRWEGLPPGGDGIPDANYARLKHDYLILADSLGEMKRLVDTAIVFEVMPHWLAVEVGAARYLRSGDERQQVRFLDAMERLTLAYESMQARKAAERVDLREVA